MRYASRFDWFLLISSLSFGALNGIIGPFVLIINLKLVGTLLRAEAEYHSGGIDMDKFSSGMIQACLEYLAIAAAFFITGFVGVSWINGFKICSSFSF
jgi:hypothetical protein